MENIELVISNQNFDIDPVDIKILVDGKKVLEDHFAVAGDNLAQHNWHRQNIVIEKGTHRIKVLSKKGKAMLEKDFLVKKSMSITIAFWRKNQPNSKISTNFFTIDSSEEKVATM